MRPWRGDAFHRDVSQIAGSTALPQTFGDDLLGRGDRVPTTGTSVACLASREQPHA
jgi:hypothetical protein